MTAVVADLVTPLQDNSSFKAPSAETFSFKAPLLPASSSKQRRISLALASSPRVVPSSAYTFRDDTGLGREKEQSPEKSAVKGKAKMRKLDTAEGDAEEEILQEKKLRKKWSQEETQMLVEGCNKVCALVCSFLH